MSGTSVRLPPRRPQQKNTSIKLNTAEKTEQTTRHNGCRTVSFVGSCQRDIVCESTVADLDSLHWIDQMCNVLQRTWLMMQRSACSTSHQFASKGGCHERRHERKLFDKNRSKMSKSLRSTPNDTTIGM